MLAALTLAAAGLPPVIAYVGKVIVDGVVAARAGSADASHVLRWIGFELALITAASLFDRASGLVRQVAGGRVVIDINVAILKKALQLSLRQLEDPPLYDKLVRARRDASTRPLTLMHSGFELLRQTVSLAAYVALLMPFSALLVLMVLAATVPAFIAEAKFSVAGFRLKRGRSADERRLSYLELLLSSESTAKEVRILGIGQFLLDRYVSLAERLREESRRLAMRRTGWGWGLSVLSAAAFYGSYAAIALATVSGRLSLGDMTLCVVAFRQGQQAFQAILNAVAGMYDDALYMSNLFEYLDEPVETQPPIATPPSALPRERGVRFVKVGFRYPGSGRWALHGLDLFIPAGQSLALVGENGAGKTTFIKLLTRLYDATDGHILLDGRDLREWNESDLRRRIGVIFQDFAHYQLTLRENVGLGSVEHLQEEGRIQAAIDRAAAREIVNRLPLGVDTQLGRWFEGGVALSGGEWQKIALARAFVREEADILVLDEPTASLDAEAEHAVFQRFRDLAEGRTTIVVSHRFPTVRMADQIIVLQAGLVIEQGTHVELLAADGRYARLFRLQAQGYH